MIPSFIISFDPQEVSHYFILILSGFPMEFKGTHCVNGEETIQDRLDKCCCRSPRQISTSIMQIYSLIILSMRNSNDSILLLLSNVGFPRCLSYGPNSFTLKTDSMLALIEFLTFFEKRRPHKFKPTPRAKSSSHLWRVNEVGVFISVLTPKLTRFFVSKLISSFRFDNYCSSTFNSISLRWFSIVDSPRCTVSVLFESHQSTHCNPWKQIRSVFYGLFGWLDLLTNPKLS